MSLPSRKLHNAMDDLNRQQRLVAARRFLHEDAVDKFADPIAAGLGLQTFASVAVPGAG